MFVASSFQERGDVIYSDGLPVLYTIFGMPRGHVGGCSEINGVQLLCSTSCLFLRDVLVPKTLHLATRTGSVEHHECHRSTKRVRPAKRVV